MKEHFCSAEKSMITYEGSCNWCGEREGSMTQDEIIEMAQECKLIGMRPFIDGIYTEALIEFAKLVAAKEREACAKVCESIYTNGDGAECWLENAASQIRARGDA
jgi:hypothetical protein